MLRLTALLVLLMASPAVYGDLVTITALDVRANGVFGHPDVSGVTVNGLAPAGTVIADPINIAMTYSNLDLDGDSSANDAVTFTLTFTKFGTDGGNLRAFNQGVDTGFGNLNDVQVSISSVSGTTTDSGDPIVFDGFTGAAIGAGRTGDIDTTADINGTSVNVANPDTGSFQFLIGAVDFALTPTVTFDNSSTIGGSVVGRHYDLQFSTISAIPEPTAGLWVAVSALGMIGRRKWAD